MSGITFNQEEIKRRLEAALKGSNQLSSNKQRVSYYKPKNGDVIRFIPFKDGTIMHDVFYHFNIGDRKMVVCPSTKGDKCKLCEQSAKLYKKAKLEDDEDKRTEIKKAAAALRSRKNGMFLVHCKSRSDIPEVMTFNLRTFKDEWESQHSESEDEVVKVLGWMSRPEYGNIMDMDSGHDVLVSVKTINKGGKMKPYDKKSFEISPIKKPISDNPDTLKKINEGIINFEDVTFIPSYVDTAKMFASMIGEDEPSDVSDKNGQSSEGWPTHTDTPADNLKNEMDQI